MDFSIRLVLANPGGIPSPTTIQRAFAVGTPTEDLAGAVVAVDWFANLLLASGTVLVAMASAEYKDREHGGAFDWYDILAGMTLPVLFWVGSLIVLIVK